MGMGYAACYADVVSEKTVRKFCPKELKALKKALGKKHGIEDLAREARFQNNSSEIIKAVGKKAHDAYFSLVEAFELKTGLDLSIHDSGDEGDIYDDVDGAFWCMDGMYQLTPAGEAMKDNVQRKRWVDFG
jgi:hypothetical protein